jgi:hypothetical protein
MNVVIDEAEEISMKSLNRHKLGRILLKVSLTQNLYWTTFLFRATTLHWSKPYSKMEGCLWMMVVLLYRINISLFILKVLDKSVNQFHTKYNRMTTLLSILCFWDKQHDTYIVLVPVLYSNAGNFTKRNMGKKAHKNSF